MRRVPVQCCRSNSRFSVASPNSPKPGDCFLRTAEHLVLWDSIAVDCLIEDLRMNKDFEIIIFFD